MRCPRCQSDNPVGMKFCGQCAAPLVGTCAACGAANQPGNRFCGQCAAPLQRRRLGPAPNPGDLHPQAPRREDPHLEGALEGERKQVTVLFADLKGSMELLADRDPEEARKLLDPVLERMMEAVHRYEGTVNQVMGDGIMALFGAPLAHEDHAVRACYAAHDMQAAMRRYTEEVRHAHGIEVQIRVGLNSGEVVVRAIGSDLRMDYTAVGQTTHLAARMEQLATPGTIRLTADTLRLAEGYIEVKPLGPVPVKGLEAPIEVYEMVGRGPSSIPAARGGRSRAHPVRRPGDRARGAPPRARTRRGGPWPGRRPRRRAGRGQVAPGLGSHPLASRPRLARPPGRLGLLRQGDELSAGDRSPQGLLRDRGPRRPARGAGEADGEALDAGPGAGRPACQRSCRSSTCRPTTSSGPRSIRPSAAGAPWTP